MIQCNEYGEYEVAKGVPSRLFSAILVCFNLQIDVNINYRTMCGQCRVTIFGHNQRNCLTLILTNRLLLSEQDSFDYNYIRTIHKSFSLIITINSHINNALSFPMN